MRTSKIREFNKKVKDLNENSPDSIWAAFTTKPKVKNSAFCNIVVCQNSIA